MGHVSDEEKYVEKTLGLMEISRLAEYCFTC